MRSILTAFAACLVFGSCNQPQKGPDVSDIKVTLTTERFEKSLFDTTTQNLATYLVRLQQSTPDFTPIYLTDILNIDPAWPIDSVAGYVNGFINAYRPVYEQAEKMYADFTPYQQEISKGLQYVKYYFPQYKIPSQIITYIGPADGYGDILSENAFIIGLHHHLGKDFALYQSELVQQTYPDYVSRLFEPAYIAVNCMKNMVNDLYPEKNDDKPLLNQMIEKGKRLYLLSRFLPGAEEYQLIGYTKEQMKECYAKEAVIWNLFIKNNYLQLMDKSILKNYIGEGPTTPELGEGAPGNIGSFAGWQIIKKYMEKNPTLPLPQLMGMDNDLIFEEVKYKP